MKIQNHLTINIHEEGKDYSVYFESVKEAVDWLLRNKTSIEVKAKTKVLKERR